MKNISANRFVSQAYSEQLAVRPSGAAVIFGWTIAGLSYLCALWILPYHFNGGLILLGATAIFTTCMLRLSCAHVYETHLQFELLITQTEVILNTADSPAHKLIVESVPFQRILNAELFSANGIQALTLFTPDQYLQIPLWAFNDRAEAVVSQLRARGVDIMQIGEPDVGQPIEDENGRQPHAA
jgi:hypothetical protein